MGEFRSRTYKNGDKEITVFLKEKPDQEDGLVGYVTGSGLPHDVGLCFDLLPKARIPYDYLALKKNDQFQKGFIFMDETILREVMKNSSVGMFALFHELGHYIFQPTQKSLEEAQQYAKDREKAVSEGGIVDEEKTADEIAAQYIGLTVAIEGLNWLLTDSKRRADTGLYDMETAAISIKEIELRIQNLKSKEELCRS